MKRNKTVYKAVLDVTLDGTGCKLCPNLRWWAADEHRYCNENGEVLDNYKTERGKQCPLREITALNLTIAED